MIKSVQGLRSSSQLIQKQCWFVFDSKIIMLLCYARTQILSLRIHIVIGMFMCIICIYVHVCMHVGKDSFYCYSIYVICKM